MTIEQEFFEAFNIPLVHHYLYNVYIEWELSNVYNEHITMDRECKGLTKKALLNKYNNRKYLKFKVTNVKKVKNQITPEIVDKLEDIIFKMSPYYNTKSLNYNKWSKQRYYVVTLYCHRITKRRKVKSNTFEAAGFTRKDALLRLCIQLKDEIQEEVKALFIITNPTKERGKN